MKEIKVPEGYEALGRELNSALTQASTGKGKERHASGENFEDQKICWITRQVKSSPVAPMIYQAVKKLIESSRMEPDAAIREIHGAINYSCAAALLLREEKAGENSTCFKQYHARWHGSRGCGNCEDITECKQKTVVEKI